MLSEIIAEKTESRVLYIVLFAAFLLISIISTILIFYFIRHKKKSFFEAAGRKYIESLGDYDILTELFNNIIKNDEKDKLEQHIICNLIKIKLIF